MTENYPHFMKTKSTYPRNATNPQQNVDERQRKLPHSISQSNFLNQHPKKKNLQSKREKNTITLPTSQEKWNSEHNKVT